MLTHYIDILQIICIKALKKEQYTRAPPSFPPSIYLKAQDLTVSLESCLSRDSVNSNFGHQAAKQVKILN